MLWSCNLEVASRRVIGLKQLLNFNARSLPVATSAEGSSRNKNNNSTTTMSCYEANEKYMNNFI